MAQFLTLVGWKLSSIGPTRPYTTKSLLDVVNDVLFYSIKSNLPNLSSHPRLVEIITIPNLTFPDMGTGYHLKIEIKIVHMYTYVE